VKRTVIRISLVLLLGVVTSVAVAWGCGAWGPARLTGFWSNVNSLDGPYMTDELILSSDGPFWRVRGFRYVGWVLLDEFPQRTNPLRSSVEVSLDDALYHWSPHPPATTAARQQVAAGWPFVCLRGQTFMRESVVGYLGGVWGHKLDADAAGPLRVPHRPILPGLLANTAIYGGAWWAMLFGPGMFIRWRRRRAGRCAKCGYDLQGAVLGDQSSAIGVVCPECGAEH